MLYKLFFGHHKAGSTWLSNILKSASKELNKSYLYLDSGDAFNHDLKSFLSAKDYNHISVANAVYSEISTLSDFRGIHLIRDPRDIVTSGYFSHLYSHPLTKDELSTHREFLKNSPKEQGLLAEIEFDRKFFEHMVSWNYKDSRILELRYEDLVTNQFRLLLKTFKHLRLLNQDSLEKYIFKKHLIRFIPFKDNSLNSFPKEIALGIIYNNSFESLSKGRKKGVEDVTSHFRKGESGDWVNHFTPTVKKYFKKHFNDVLVTLGYESSDNW